MTLLGGFLMAMMAGLTFWTLNAYRPASPNSARFTGTPEQFRMILGLFGLIFIFGLASLIGGLWQLIFGRRKMLLIWLILGLGAALIVAGIALTRSI